MAGGLRIFFHLGDNSSGKILLLYVIKVVKTIFFILITKRFKIILIFVKLRKLFNTNRVQLMAKCDWLTNRKALNLSSVETINVGTRTIVIFNFIQHFLHI